MDTVRRRVVGPRWIVVLLACALMSALMGSAGAAPTPSPTPPAPSGTITGRVIWNDGTPAPASIVVLRGGVDHVKTIRTPLSGRFRVSGLPAGRYQLQISDQSPRWQTTCFAARSQWVTVGLGQTVARHVLVRRGAFITGRITRGPNNARARYARVAASDSTGLSLDVRSNNRGEFALCGFNRGAVRAWAYDAQRRWVGKPRDVRVRPARGVNIVMRMRNPAGAIHGFVHVDGTLPRKPMWITAVSRRTGQWWVVPVRRGEMSLRGLVPGRYTLTFPAVGSFRGGSVSPRLVVRPGQSRAITVWLSRSGIRIG